MILFNAKQSNFLKTMDESFILWEFNSFFIEQGEWGLFVAKLSFLLPQPPRTF